MLAADEVGPASCRMCFSATASFTAAGVTSVAGAVALRSAPRPSYMLLGAIPLFFAAHQFAEGVLWLSLSGQASADWARPATLTFLSFAEVVWPFWVPLAILAVEREPGRRRLLMALTGLGIGLAAAQAYGLVAYPVTAAILGSHIEYRLETPWLFRWITDVAYVLTTVVPPLVSGSRLIRNLGVLVLASFVLSKIMFLETFISVWCFLAAFISALVVLFVRAADRGERGALGRTP